MKQTINYDTEKKETAKRLKAIRKLQKKTKPEYAEMLGISLSAYSKLETGENDFSCKTLRLLSKNGISVDYLLTGTNKDIVNIAASMHELSNDEKAELLMAIALGIKNE